MSDGLSKELEYILQLIQKNQQTINEQVTILNQKIEALAVDVVSLKTIQSFEEGKAKGIEHIERKIVVNRQFEFSKIQIVGAALFFIIEQMIVIGLAVKFVG